MVPFPYLLLPSYWSSRNRARRREKGDLLRGIVFGVIGLGVCGALFGGAFWLTLQAAKYDELGDFLLRLGLSWLFLMFLSFLAFSGVVTALSTFFLSADLRLLLAAPVDKRRLFYARYAKTLGLASWMVLIFLLPVLAGIGVARCAPAVFYLTAGLTLTPFVVIPVALGSAVTLTLVNVFPARRAKDILMMMGLLFAASIVLLLRYIQPERLLRVESLPDITGFFTTLQSPVTPLLPSFWAGETLFAGLQGGVDLLHTSALWTTALGMTVLLRAANERWYFTGFSRAQEARKVRFTQLGWLAGLASLLPLSAVRQQLLIKDLKVFLRDVTQWSQLLLLCALVLVYLFNFRVIDLDRIPYMSDVVKNVYGFVNLGMAGLVMATVAVRFVFPAVSAEGRGVLDHPDVADRAGRLSLVEVLDRSGAGPYPDRRADDRRQRTPRDRPVPEAGLGGSDRLHELRAGRAGDRARRPLSALRGRQRDPGCRILRRCHVHDWRCLLRAGDDRAHRLALDALPLAPGPGRAAVDRAAGRHGNMFRDGRDRQSRDLVAVDALRRAGAGGDGQDAGLTGKPFRMQLIFEQIRTGGDRNFAYLLGDREANEGVLIDPSYAPEAVVERARAQGLTVTHIVNTHGHADHIEGNPKAVELTSAPVAAFPGSPAEPSVPLGDGAVIAVGGLPADVPAHPGSLCGPSGAARGVAAAAGHRRLDLCRQGGRHAD